MISKEKRNVIARIFLEIHPFSAATPRNLKVLYKKKKKGKFNVKNDTFSLLGETNWSKILMTVVQSRETLRTVDFISTRALVGS